MKKAIIMLGLLGLMIQPVSAQCLNSNNPVAAPTGAATNIYPIAQPAAQTTGSSVAGGTMEPVKVEKRHWYLRTHTGYRVVNPSSTGYAVPIQALGSNCNNTGFAVPLQSPCSSTGFAVPLQPSCSSCTGGAANSNLEPVLMPKRHFWEGDRVELMQINAPKTGGAAPIFLYPVQGAPSGAATTINISPEQYNTEPITKAPVKKHKTGGASSVRGYW